MSRPLTPDALVELDLNTWEKLPALAEILGPAEPPALDLGCGLGYYARRLLASASRPVAVDFDLGTLVGGRTALCACQADARALPFRDGTFATMLLADVLEHCQDDQAVLAELARVSRPGARLAISVPSLERGGPDLLTRAGIPTVHDRPGPEHHYRAGYRAADLRELLDRAGFSVIRVSSCARLGARVLIDSIALGHLVLQRLGGGRGSWTWGQILAQPSLPLRLYRRLFPAVRLLHRLVGGWGRAPGTQLLMVAERR